jgi:hypothetical protein
MGDVTKMVRTSGNQTELGRLGIQILEIPFMHVCPVIRKHGQIITGYFNLGMKLL